MNDQRLARRSPRSVTLLIADRVPAQCTDLGPGGACVAMAGVFLPGARIHGSVHVDGQDFPFVGEVAWAKPGDLRRGRLSRFGIRFLQVAPGLLAVLAAYEADSAGAPLAADRPRTMVRRPRVTLPAARH